MLRLALPNECERRVGLVGRLAEILRAKGEKVKEHRSWLEFPDGLRLLPQFLNAERKEDGRWQVTTTIEAIHGIHFPHGVFEFQHAIDSDPENAVVTGFEQFADLDFPVLAESLRETLKDCTALRFARATVPFNLPSARRVVLGPPMHFLNKQSEAAAQLDSHPFCPCCFFTHLGENVIQALLLRQEFLAIRFFAARTAPGELSIDCRLNGIEWTEGQQALLAYVATWPERGFEIRKQYVAIQAME